ncbi:Na+/glucose cotransporter [Proteiniphilum saccharofermentans]|uniref:Na+/glucose cotransporter n=1 Tax=Proteiniphilum saccharofermentans TaxID=1642647 RepID=A0A1R3TCZ1_9BACT|nr:sodium/solute symporter [Proteiniphilum saccharofermentans]SCD21484.1 Na+/glucose cotransporter [Proteiniphilum saccharofermentans]
MDALIQLSSVDIAVIIAYFILLGIIAYWSGFSKKNRSDNLFLANKSLGWLAIGLTMWGTNVGPSMLIANASSGYESGIVAGNFSWYAFLFIFLLAFVFAPRYLGAEVTTLPEYMGKRFGDTSRRYIAWYTVVTTLISWLGLTLFSGGIFMAQILDLPLWLCIVLLVLVSALFVITGGLKTIAYTNVFQMLLLIGVSFLLVVLALHKIGGIGSVIEATPPTYWKLFQPLEDKDFPWLAILLGYPVMGIWFWCTDQSMVQSVLGAKNLKEGQKGANFVAWLKLIDIPLFILPGILAFILLPDLSNSTDAYLSLVQAVLPIGLTGLVVVVMLAALISTIGSALNSLSTVFTMDIIKRYKPDIEQKEIKKIGRIVVLTGAILSVFLAIGISSIRGLSFFNIFQSVLGFLAPPMAAAFLSAVLWKKTSRNAVNWVLSAGTLCSLGTGLLYYGNVVFQGIHYLYVSALIFVILCLFLFLYSLFDKSDDTARLLDYRPVKVDRSVKIVWLVLILVMVMVYIIFN